MKAARTIGAIIADAERLGREIAEHGRPEAARLTKAAWAAAAEDLAGGADQLAAAVQRVATRPHLQAHLAAIAREWCHAPHVDRPGPVGIANFERHPAVATEATVERITPELAGAVVAGMVLEDSSSTFGTADRPGAAAEKIAALRGELDRLNVELRAAIPAELVIERAHLRTADGRLVEWFEPAPAVHLANVLTASPPAIRAAA